MKKAVLPVVLAILFLTGCTSAHSKPQEAAGTHETALTLFDTDALKIEREGLRTTITDKESGTEYRYKATLKARTEPPTLEDMQRACTARTVAESDNLRIETAGAVLIVHDATNTKTYYINMK